MISPEAVQLLRQDCWALVVYGVVAAAIFVTTRIAIPRRRLLRPLIVIAVGLTPLLLPRYQHVIRLAAVLLSVVYSVKIWDLAGDESAAELSIIAFVAYLLNPFAIVRRLVLAEKQDAARDWKSIVFNTFFGAIALGIAFGIFQIDWIRYPAILERSAKTFAVFFVILFIPNALAAANRRVGIPSTDFCVPFIFARTPAEFWRFYNRPAEQFFRVYVFNPAGGLRHFVRATIATFIVSGLIHEYVFDIPAGRMLGTQLLFFSIQCAAVLATANYRPRGLQAVVATLATFTFNVLTGVIFMSSMNAVVPISSTR